MLKEDIINYVKNSDYQVENLKNLSQMRGLDVDFLINEGIFFVKIIDDLWDMIDEIGISEHSIGITEKNQALFRDGYIIPIFDAYDRVLMFINYNPDRGSASKYFNINVYKRAEVTPEEDETYDGSRDELLHEGVKMIGLEMTTLGLMEDRMFVVEGVFDNKRLKSLGIPATGLLGSKIMPYHKLYYKRFSKVYYLQDVDTTGDSAWRKFKREVPQAERVLIPSLRYLDANEEIHYIKDIDEFGLKGLEGKYETEWEEFSTYLKNLGKRD